MTRLELADRLFRLKWKAIVFGFLAASFFSPDLIALSESEYREKYRFAAEHAPASTELHRNGHFGVVSKLSVRECDADKGDLIILTFLQGAEVIRSYTLKDLFPDPERWIFHRATGVFLWTIFSPKSNAFHGEVYSVSTVSGVRSFRLATGELIETE